MARLQSHKFITCVHHEQSEAYCGPASLKIFLSHFGIRFSEKQLSTLACASRKYGTEYHDMTRALKKLGGRVIEKKNATIHDIDTMIHTRHLPVIVAWFDNDFAHYSVIVNTTPKYLVLIDPAGPAKFRTIAKKHFPHIWFGFVGKKNDRLIWGWMLTAEFLPRKNPHPIVED